MSNPKISILLPLYNGKNYLDYSLKSLLLQTYDNFEVLITDDGSSDRSVQYINQNFSDNRIKIYTQENKGKNSALNNSLSNSKGNYVTIFDQDDYLNNFYLENVVQAINSTNADCILTTAKVVYGYCPQLQSSKCQISNDNQTDIIDYVSAMNLYCSDGSIHFYLWNKIFKKQIFEGFRFNPELILDDISSTHLLMARCETFSVVRNSVYYHTSSLSSLGTKTYTRVITEELARTYLDRFKHFEYHAHDTKYYKLIYKDTINILMALYLKLIPVSSNLDLILRVNGFLKSNQDNLEANTSRSMYLLSRYILDKDLNIKMKILKIPLIIIIYLNIILKKIRRLIKYYFKKYFEPC